MFLIITENLKKKNLITCNQNLLANFKVLDLIGNLQFTSVLQWSMDRAFYLLPVACSAPAYA